MADDIVLTFAHDLGVEEATRRLQSGLERLKSEFAGRLTTADVTWQGPHADLRVGAFGQIITAALDVEAKQIRIAIQLPRILAALATPIKRYLDRAGPEILRLPPPS